MTRHNFCDLSDGYRRVHECTIWEYILAVGVDIALSLYARRYSIACPLQLPYCTLPPGLLSGRDGPFLYLLTSLWWIPCAKAPSHIPLICTTQQRKHITLLQMDDKSKFNLGDIKTKCIAMSVIIRCNSHTASLLLIASGIWTFLHSTNENRSSHLILQLRL